MLSACVELPNDRASDYLVRALEDYRAGFVSGSQLADAVAVAVERVRQSDDRADECEADAARLTDSNDVLERRAKVAEWQLEVALAALEELRKLVGGQCVKIEYASERMASTVCVPSASDMAKHEGSIRAALNELYAATGELNLPDENEIMHFRKVAARFDLLKKEP